MRDKKFIVMLLQGNKVIEESDIVEAVDWMSLMDTKVYKEMKKKIIPEYADWHKTPDNYMRVSYRRVK